MTTIDDQMQRVRVHVVLLDDDQREHVDRNRGILWDTLEANQLPADPSHLRALALGARMLLEQTGLLLERVDAGPILPAVIAQHQAFTKLLQAVVALDLTVEEHIEGTAQLIGEVTG